MTTGSTIEQAAPSSSRSRGPARTSATRWAPGTRSPRRAPRAPRSSGWCWSAAPPGSPIQTERAARVADDEAKARHLEQIGVDAFVDEWLAQPMFAGLAASDADADVDRRHRLRNTVEGPGGKPASRRDRRAGADVGHAAREMQIPVLVLAGERDRKFTDIGRRMAAAMPNATFAAIPNAGHAAHAEQPESTAALVAGWLARLTEREAERQQRAVGELDRAGSAEHGDQVPADSTASARAAPAQRRRLTRQRAPAPTTAGRGRRRAAATSAPATRTTYNQRVASVAEPHRERALARRRVGRDVAQVVDDQQRARRGSRRRTPPATPTHGTCSIAT